MKTICPHCHQEFPETPDEYLGQTLECTVCHNEFICEKPKFCSECGAMNTARAITCHQCGNSFPVMRQPVSSPVRNCGSGLYASSDDDEDDCFYEDVNLFTAWRNILNFSGRSCRKECWFYALPNVVIFLILSFCIPGIVDYVAIVLALIGIPLGVRRLHDMGLSGWCILILLIITPLWLALLICPSQPGENKWGLNPVGVSSDNRPHRMYIVLSFVAAIAVIAAMLVPAFIQVNIRREEIKKRLACSSNIKQIGLAIKLFECDNPGKFPEDLQVLRKKKYISETAFQCPSSAKGYVYLGNGLSMDYETPDIPVLMDAPFNHGKFVNILYMDGLVQGYMLSREMTSCEAVLKELHPKLSQSRAGAIVLENARKVDAAQIR